MIKVEELRIGNCIQNKNGFVSYITGIFKESVHVDFDGNNGDIFKIDSGDLYHVTLTEDLLLKCGFKKILGGIGWDKFIKDGVELSFAPLVGGGYIPVYRFNNDYIKIRFLHQLQNLFWCLSQKELEVNL